MVSLPRWSLILTRTVNTTSNPFTLLNTPKPTPKHPLFCPELESGQNELQSGQFGPQLGKMFEKWENFSRSGQKKKFYI